MSVSPFSGRWCRFGYKATGSPASQSPSQTRDFQSLESAYVAGILFCSVVFLKQTRGAKAGFSSATSRFLLLRLGDLWKACFESPAASQAVSMSHSHSQKSPGRTGDAPRSPSAGGSAAHPGWERSPGALLCRFARRKAVRSGFRARNGLCSSFLAPVMSDCKSLSHLFLFPTRHVTVSPISLYARAGARRSGLKWNRCLRHLPKMAEGLGAPGLGPDAVGSP